MEYNVCTYGQGTTARGKSLRHESQKLLLFLQSPQYFEASEGLWSIEDKWFSAFEVRQIRDSIKF